MTYSVFGGTLNLALSDVDNVKNSFTVAPFVVQTAARWRRRLQSVALISVRLLSMLRGRNRHRRRRRRGDVCGAAEILMSYVGSMTRSRPHWTWQACAWKHQFISQRRLLGAHLRPHYNAKQLMSAFVDRAAPARSGLFGRKIDRFQHTLMTGRASSWLPHGI